MRARTGGTKEYLTLWFSEIVEDDAEEEEAQ